MTQRERRTKGGLNTGIAFLLLCIANLACFSMTSTHALLPIIAEMDGVGTPTAGLAMSASVITVIVLGLVCGKQMARRGAGRPLALGYTLAILANVSLEVLPVTGTTLVAMRLVHGAALGLMTPAALVLGREVASRMGGFSTFALFTTTIPGAQFIGPPVGDLLLRHGGREGYFLMTSAVGFLGLVLFLVFLKMQPDTEVKPGARSATGYRTLARQRKFATPLIANIFPALFWGYVLSYLPLALKSLETSIPIFFQTMTAAIIVSRFTLSKVIKPEHPRANLAVCLTGMTLAFAALTSAGGTAGSLIAAALFGASFGIVPPLLTHWIAGVASDRERAEAVTLGNTVFNFCTFLTAGICAVALKWSDIVSVQLWFSALVGATGVLAIAIDPSRTKPSAQQLPSVAGGAAPSAGTMHRPIRENSVERAEGHPGKELAARCLYRDGEKPAGHQPEPGPARPCEQRESGARRGPPYRSTPHLGGRREA